MNSSEKSDNIIGELENVYKQTELRLFIDFVSVPKVYREEIFGFANEQDFAEKYKLSQDTLTDWKRKEGFWDEVAKFRDRWARRKTTDVVAALLRNILKNGDKAEVEFWFKKFEGFRDVSDINIISEVDRRTAEISDILKKWNNEPTRDEDRTIDLRTRTPQAIAQGLRDEPISA